MMQTIPIKETRERLADLINQVEVGGKQFIITKFGKPKAMLVPVWDDRKRKSSKAKKLPGFGIWKDREDMKDPDVWVRNLRRQWARRYE